MRVRGVANVLMRFPASGEVGWHTTVIMPGGLRNGGAGEKLCGWEEPGGRILLVQSRGRLPAFEVLEVHSGAIAGM